jgi:hypothetical protein
LEDGLGGIVGTGLGGIVGEGRGGSLVEVVCEVRGITDDEENEVWNPGRFSESAAILLGSSFLKT